MHEQMHFDYNSWSIYLHSIYIQLYEISQICYHLLMHTNMRSHWRSVSRTSNHEEPQNTHF